MLKDAKRLYEEKSLRSAADRAYYSMFHAAHAALAHQGVKAPRSHRELVSTGVIEREYSRDLTKAHEARQESTYEAYGQIDDQEVADLISGAEGFLARIKRLTTEA
jgi:uncharacterized protein (UPF0332 family)